MKVIYTQLLLWINFFYKNSSFSNEWTNFAALKVGKFIPSLLAVSQFGRNSRSSSRLPHHPGKVRWSCQSGERCPFLENVNYFTFLIIGQFKIHKSYAFKVFYVKLSSCLHLGQNNLFWQLHLGCFECSEIYIALCRSNNVDFSLITRFWRMNCFRSFQETKSIFQTKFTCVKDYYIFCIYAYVFWIKNKILGFSFHL